MVRPIARKVLNAEYAAVRAPLAALDEKVTGKLPKQSRRRRAVEQSIGALDAVADRVLPERRRAPRTAPAAKTPASNSPAKKAPAQKTPAKKTPATKTAAKKTAAKKAPAKKTAAKKTAAKKSTR